MSDSRSAFLAVLRAGLRGIPAKAIEEIIADYAVHFDEGVAANRSEADIARSLGDPVALAEELRAEARIERWEKARSPRSGFNVLGSVLALGVLNAALILVVVPLLCLFGFITIVFSLALLAFAAALPFAHIPIALPGGVLAMSLTSVGSIAAAVALLSIAMLCGIAFVDGISRYARLHYRVLSRDLVRGSI